MTKLITQKRCADLAKAEKEFYAELLMLNEFEEISMHQLAEKHADRPVVFAEQSDLVAKKYGAKRQAVHRKYQQILQNINDRILT